MARNRLGKLKRKARQRRERLKKRFQGQHSLFWKVGINPRRLLEERIQAALSRAHALPRLQQKEVVQGRFEKEHEQLMDEQQFQREVYGMIRIIVACFILLIALIVHYVVRSGTP